MNRNERAEHELVLHKMANPAGEARAIYDQMTNPGTWAFYHADFQEWDGYHFTANVGTLNYIQFPSTGLWYANYRFAISDSTSALAQTRFRFNTHQRAAYNVEPGHMPNPLITTGTTVLNVTHVNQLLELAYVTHSGGNPSDASEGVYIRFVRIGDPVT